MKVPPSRAGSSSRATLAAVLAIGVVSVSCGLPGKASGPGGKYRRCASVRDRGDGSVSAGGVTCAWDGHVGLCEPSPSGTFDLCLVSGISGDADTARSLRSFAAWCGNGGAEAMVALGGIGRSEEEIDRAMDALSAPGVPILAMPGATEVYGEYLDAVESAVERNVPVVDLSVVRVLEWGDFVIVSIPGIAQPRYLAHPGEGCGWGEDDVEEMEGLLREAGEKGRVVVLGSSPPLGSGGAGIDTSREGTHVGDAGLAAALAEASVGLAAFGFVHEAGGTAVDPETGALLPAGAWSPSVYLNPGSIEAVPWSGSGAGGYSTGQAAVLHLGPEGGAYHVWRAGEASP